MVAHVRPVEQADDEVPIVAQSVNSGPERIFVQLRHRSEFPSAAIKLALTGLAGTVVGAALYLALHKRGAQDSAWRVAEKRTLRDLLDEHPDADIHDHPRIETDNGTIVLDFLVLGRDRPRAVERKHVRELRAAHVRQAATQADAVNGESELRISRMTRVPASVEALAALHDVEIRRDR